MEAKPHPKPALPLIALIALASALGVTVAVVLASVAMLLAAPAYAEDGRLFLEHRDGLAPAALLFSECDSQGDGRTRIVEAYRNPFDEPLAGLYAYRLPEDAVLERVAFASHSIGPAHAVMRRRYAKALIERTTEIGPGETLKVELEYRRRGPARLRSAYDARCCSPS